MNNKGYANFIFDFIEKQPFNTPIYTKDLIEVVLEKFGIEVKNARTIVNVNLHRLEGERRLERYQKGIYYRPKATAFGKTKLNPAQINKDRFLERNGLTIGYETGAAFLNRIGLSTQIPRYRKYATNVYKQRGTRVEKKLNVIIKKPKTEIDNGNYRYLQFLDAVENKEKAVIDVDNPNMILHKYIIEQNLDLEKIIGLAGKYYNKKTQLKLYEIIPGIA